MTLPFPVESGRPGSARVEYRACQEDIEAMLAQGYTARIVYEHMKKQGRITCSYSAFCDYVRGGGKRKHATGQSKRQLRASSPQQTGPRIIRHESKPLVRPSDIDPNTLF
jgi:hypothetical protein